MRDSWTAGDRYEYFMGRWSRLAAQAFIDWLAPSPKLKWLDVGCGSGALSTAVCNKLQPTHLTALDQSEGFVKTVQNQLGNLINCCVGSALALPLADNSVNFTISGLVLNFIPEPEKAAAEMRRVTAPGGTVAIYVWDYAGTMDFLNFFWDVATSIDPKAAILHESHRFPNCNAAGLEGIFERAGFEEINIAPLDIMTHFPNFDDYWRPFLGGQGPAPTYVASLGKSERETLRSTLHERLPIQPDGSIALFARAWAVSSLV